MAEASRRVAERKPFHDLTASVLILSGGVYSIWSGGNATAIGLGMLVAVSLVNTVQLRDFIEAYYMAKSPEAYQVHEEEQEKYR